MRYFSSRWLTFALVVLIVLIGFELWFYYSLQNKSGGKLFCPVPRQFIFCPQGQRVVLRAEEQGIGFALKEGSPFFAPISGTLRQSGSITFAKSIGGGTYPLMEIEGADGQKAIIIYSGPIKAQLREVKAGEKLDKLDQGWIAPYGKVNLLLKVMDADGALVPFQKITFR